MRLPFRAATLTAAFIGLLSSSFGQTTPPQDPTNPFDYGNKPASTVTALTKENKDEVLKALADVVTKQAFVPGVDLSKWPEYLEKERADIDSAEKEADFARSVNKALRDFGISHIRFITSRGSQMRRQTTTIGVGVQARKVDKALEVTYVFPKSPGETAGLRTGEVIVRVDGKEPQSPEVLQGEEGSESTLTVKGSDGVEREIKIKRAPYQSVRQDTLTWVDDEAAVLKIHSFSQGYNRDNVKKMMEEAAGKAKYLVVDLRSNGGGAVNNLSNLLSYFLPARAEIGTFIYRRTSERYAQDHDGKVETDPVVIAKGTTDRFRTEAGDKVRFAGKVAVLTNRGSASASEIFAAALREHLKSPLVGQQTAGAVLASVFRKLPLGFEIQYPISDYVTRDFRRLEKNPLLPDLEVTERPTDGNDPAVAKALETLRTATGAQF